MIKWSAFEDLSFSTLYIDTEAHLAEPPFQQRYQLWDGLFPVTRNSAAYFLDHNNSMLVLLMTSIALWLYKREM